MARAIVGAEMQVITYREFLPTYCSAPEAHVTKYARLRPDETNPSGRQRVRDREPIRFGHSMLSARSPAAHRAPKRPLDRRYGASGRCANAFFSPLTAHVTSTASSRCCAGSRWQPAQEIDRFEVDRRGAQLPVRSARQPVASISPALNIQRGRDHGLASYNDVREAMGFERAESFADVSSDAEIQRRLAEAYESVDDIDLWVGGLSEDHVPGALVGPLVRSILIEQFQRPARRRSLLVRVEHAQGDREDPREEGPPFAGDGAEHLDPQGRDLAQRVPRA